MSHTGDWEVELQHPHDWGCVLLRPSPQKLGIYYLDGRARSPPRYQTQVREITKMVVDETRISEAKVTIRELFEGITDWMPGFPESWSTSPGSAKRLLD